MHFPINLVIHKEMSLEFKCNKIHHIFSAWYFTSWYNLVSLIRTMTSSILMYCLIKTNRQDGITLWKKKFKYSQWTSLVPTKVRQMFNTYRHNNLNFQRGFDIHVFSYIDMIAKIIILQTTAPIFSTTLLTKTLI